jgi:hypothetical protein
MSTAHLIGREEVMAFLDGEVAPPRAAIVRAHVEGCAECTAAADDWRALSESLREWRVEGAPDTLVAPAPAVARRVVISRAMTRNFWRAAPWIAAAAAVMVVSYVVMPDARPGPAATPAPSQSALSSLGYVSGRGGRQSALKQRDDAVNERRQLQNAPAQPQSSFDKDAVDSIQVVTGGGDAVAEAKKTAAADPRMIVRNASLGLSTDHFGDILKRMQTVAGQHGGTVSAYQVSGDAAYGRALSTTVRIPVAAMDAALVDLRRLGTVTGESQSTEEITDAHRDLAIRIENAKKEAARLNELLTRQSDRLSDVLEVEQAQARVQTEIEQMTAQETAMRGRAAMSTISISVAEVRHAELALGPLPIGRRIRNAMVDGLRAATESALGAVLALIALAPTALLWLVLAVPVGFAAWWATKLLRSRRAS